jgi:hypothetical protein
VADVLPELGAAKGGHLPAVQQHRAVLEPGRRLHRRPFGEQAAVMRGQWRRTFQQGHS